MRGEAAAGLPPRAEEALHHRLQQAVLQGQEGGLPLEQHLLVLLPHVFFILSARVSRL